MSALARGTGKWSLGPIARLADSGSECPGPRLRSGRNGFPASPRGSGWVVAVSGNGFASILASGKALDLGIKALVHFFRQPEGTVPANRLVSGSRRSRRIDLRAYGIE